MSQEKISVYNLADLKNTSDDAIPNYLNSLRFVQSHRLTDVRLALGYGALAVAVACFLWDYKLGFDSTKYYSALAVLVYMALNVALTYWSRYVEGATVYVGTSPSGETITIATSVEKYTPVYNVDITITSKSKAVAQKIAVSRPFSEWFDSAGSFIAAPFQAVLATAVPAIGQADPRRVASVAPATEASAAPAPAPATSSQAAYSPAVLEMLAAGAAADASESDSGVATATGTAGKKSGKRRKAAPKAA
ncbi:signal peptidase protein complex [Sporothrix brasiliensis 5110]|uniref:Signal peptidase complex subunit 2 n=1 Tax=Sporothrix brasiliensis 5110 TaxID=1398154 RepID=A0A0C2FJQ9_9PEZI|nr:signal peptidase protein complex [Sporothrix brasiliensis 5110]KIH91263.1 signal peptidase protein complex [Sporothrix brasiliensis 5110]